MIKRSAILDLSALFALTTENLGRGSGSWQAAEIQICKEHMQVELISSNQDVMTHDRLSSEALT